MELTLLLLEMMFQTSIIRWNVPKFELIYGSKKMLQTQSGCSNAIWDASFKDKPSILILFARRYSRNQLKLNTDIL
jgi:hypothetical protein